MVQSLPFLKAKSIYGKDDCNNFLLRDICSLAGEIAPKTFVVLEVPWRFLGIEPRRTVYMKSTLQVGRLTMSTAISCWPFVAVTLAIILIFYSQRRRQSQTYYPPGPKPRFFVGNLFDIPTSEPWKAFRDLGNIYGDLIHFQVLGRHAVVINSWKLADRMLEKRSKIYSDRAWIPMLEITGWTKLNFGLKRYGQEWRMHKKLFTQGFRAAVVPDYQPILSSKASQLLSSLRQNPDMFVAHIKTYGAATILATVYGYDIAPSNDRLVDLSEEAMRTGSVGAHPSAVLVNVLPFLRHLPLQLPIFAFQRIARRTQRVLNEMRTVPYEFVKNNMETGEGNFSLLAKFLEDHAAKGGDKYQEDMIMDVAATAYAGGADTTVSVLLVFFLVMALHPEIQKRAQCELDPILGKGPLPTYVDRSDFPYIEAILRETQRWSPTLPLGVPRAAFLDDTIDGYFIPKGTFVISNLWAMTRDEAVYPQPECFIPERFLTKDGTCNEDEMLLPFGFGRRSCTGRHFARPALWTAMVSVLSQFDIGPAEDEAGRPITRLADVKFSDGLLIHPERFRCVIKARIQ